MNKRQVKVGNPRHADEHIARKGSEAMPHVSVVAEPWYEPEAPAAPRRGPVERQVAEFRMTTPKPVTKAFSAVPAKEPYIKYRNEEDWARGMRIQAARDMEAYNRRVVGRNYTMSAEKIAKMNAAQKAVRIKIELNERHNPCSLTNLIKAELKRGPATVRQLCEKVGRSDSAVRARLRKNTRDFVIMGEEKIGSTGGVAPVWGLKE